MGTSDTPDGVSLPVTPENTPLERCDACLDVVRPATKQLLMKHSRPSGRFFTSSAFCDQHAKLYAQDGKYAFFIQELDL